MPSSRDSAIKFIRENHKRFLDELIDFLKIPSVSTNPENKMDVQRAAEWTADKLRLSGMRRVEIFPTEGNPIVYGELTAAGKGAPTVLIYGHYDVQPPDPIDLWESRPFEPAQRSVNLYARGASDMKGQIMASIKAVEAIVHSGGPAANIKFILEGEEEIGSPNLVPFIAQNKNLLSCDCCLNPDAGMISADIPTITYALRGIACYEIRIHGPKKDLHSGLFGGAVHNPAQVLSELIAGMHDGKGRVTLPGFYDKVRAIDVEERRELARLPLDETFFLEQTGSPALWGESDYTPVERIGARPTLEVNGLLSGFTGEGFKTVLPEHAMAKISMRLVPNQGPEDVNEQLENYLKANAPPTITWELIKMGGGPASISDRNSAGTRALSLSMETVWNKKPLFKREGGSIPVVAHLQELLGVESVLTGFSLPDDNMHAPNEKLHLPTWYRGIEALAHFFYNIAEQ